MPVTKQTDTAMSRRTRDLELSYQDGYKDGHAGKRYQAEYYLINFGSQHAGAYARGFAKGQRDYDNDLRDGRVQA